MSTLWGGDRINWKQGQRNAKRAGFVIDKSRFKSKIDR